MAELLNHRRRFLASALGNIGLIGCCHTKIAGNSRMLAALAASSREQGLGISHLGYDVIYTQYFPELNLASRRDYKIEHSFEFGRARWLVDWGCALLVQDDAVLIVRDLRGPTLGEIEQAAIDIHGCVFQRNKQQVLFWGKEYKSRQYGFYLGRLDDHTIRTIYQFRLASEDALPNTTASFTKDPSLIRICVGFETYLIGLEGELIETEPWKMEFVEGGPNGDVLSGRQRNGTLSLIDLRTRTTLDTGVACMGRSKWDPSSRYILTARRIGALPWCGSTELVVIDSFTRDIVTLPPIILDDQEHPYEWVLLQSDGLQQRR